jgi:aminoglycoside/choline kinase family phosphotransferase
MAPDTHLDPATQAARAAAALWHAAARLELLTPEASARRYWRLHVEEGPRWLLVTGGPPPQATTSFLRGLKLRAPKLGDATEEAYLVQDLGDRHLADDPHPARYNALLEDWLRFSFEELPEHHPNRALALDRQLFLRELRQFADSYLHDWRGLELPATDWEDLHAALRLGAGESAAGPSSLQHRDFHSRNLLIPDAAAPVWIDHQDLRRGPVFYDLASLLTDAYVDLPRTMVRRLCAEVELIARTLDLGFRPAQEQFLQVAWQRLLKALGTFGKLLTSGRLEYAAMEQRALGHVAMLQELGPTPGWVLPFLPHLEAKPEDDEE